MSRPAAARRGCVALVAACLLATTVACSLGTVGVWRGALAPPWFERSLGPLRLVGYSTWNADCPPFEGCAPTRNEAYVIWLSWETAGQRRDARRLLSLPIER